MTSPYDRPESIPEYVWQDIGVSTPNQIHNTVKLALVRAYTAGLRAAEFNEKTLLIKRLKEYAAHGDTTQLLILAQLMEKELEALL